MGAWVPGTTEIWTSRRAGDRQTTWGPHEAPRVHPQLYLPRLVRLLKLDQGEASRLINLVCGRKTLGRKCSEVFCWLYVRIRTALTVFVSRFCVFGELRRRYQRTFFKKFACREIFRASSQFEHGTSKSYPNDVTINRIGHCHSSGQECHNVPQLDPVAKGRVLVAKVRPLKISMNIGVRQWISRTSPNFFLFF